MWKKKFQPIYINTFAMIKNNYPDIFLLKESMEQKVIY